MRLVVGLGNPGAEYEATRHNAGFWWVENLAHVHRVRFKNEPRFHGRVGRITGGGHDCWLLLPQTFMNLSGRAVAAMARFYKIEVDEILVVHDELDLLPGVARLKKGGGTAGHNGLKDIARHLGPEFWRLRIGIGHPGERARVMEFVLHPPLAAETPLISAAIERALEVWPLIASGEMEKAMHRLHTQASP
ncbi:MAG TPA: aminoacyl-tRNA hydrolase [Burkholderiales bacterium]|nr:aminoacyl-tRNA hydrolase [Burkholderiales bacterium]